MDNTDLVARVQALEAELARLKEMASGETQNTVRDIEPPGESLVGPSASRRDVLRYGAVALGAAAAGLSARSVQAANGDPVTIATINTGTLPTTVHLSTNDVSAFEGQSSGANGIGISGSCNGGGGRGVVGFSNGGSGTGVYGSASATNGVGVHGRASASSGATAGVRGECLSPAGFALRGVNSFGGTAVLGELPVSTNQNGIALYGLNNSSYAGPGPGAGGFGVYGLSAKGHGLVGATASAGGAAVVGATNGVAGAYAAAFYGPVIVGGDFTVFGAKSAAVPHPDGSHRRLYCVESPESWFEDFGKEQLSDGCAEIVLDPDFAAVVDLTDYHVFLTPYGRYDGWLGVTEQTPHSFRVEASDVSRSTRFSWRIVAKRKDIAGPRLETVTVPPEPTLPLIPNVRPSAGVDSTGLG